MAQVVAAAASLVAVLMALAPDAAAAPDAEGKLVPLKTSLPKPVFVGTPRFIVSPNLEKPTGKLRRVYHVPAGTTNVAAGKRVTSSCAEPFFGEVSVVTDGNKEARGDSFVELALGSQWIRIDLGRTCEIHAVIVWHYHAEARVYHDVVVQLGEAAASVGETVTLFNNDHDNSSGLGVGSDKEYVETFEGRLIEGHGRRARYVRLHSNGNTTDDTNSYIEVEVHGRPVAP